MNPYREVMSHLIVGPADIDAATRTIALAFEDDPVWGPALRREDGDTAHLVRFWRPFVEGAARFETAYMLEGASSVAVWIPPGESDLTELQEQAVADVAQDALTPGQLVDLDQLTHRFDLARATDPHAYLSLLATHPVSRGRGIGQRLLAENLAEFDRRNTATYLESTNPANDHRYHRVGFATIGGFTSVIDDAPIARMWRPVGG